MKPRIWFAAAVFVALALAVVGCDSNVQLGVAPPSDGAVADAADAGAGG